MRSPYSDNLSDTTVNLTALSKFIKLLLASHFKHSIKMQQRRPEWWQQRQFNCCFWRHSQSYRLSTTSFRSCPALYKSTPYVPVLFYFPAEVTPTFASLQRCSEIDFSFMLNGCDASGTCTLRSRAPPALTFGHSTHGSKWILATFYFVERIITWLLWKYRTPAEY